MPEPESPAAPCSWRAPDRQAAPIGARANVTVHLAGNGFLPVLVDRHGHLRDIARQALQAAGRRHVRHLGWRQRPGGRIQGAKGSRVQIEAGIRYGGRRRALRQKVALPTTLHISRTFEQRTGIDRVASTIGHRVNHQSAAPCRIGRCDDFEVRNVLDPPLVLRRQVDVGDDRVVVGTVRLELTEYPARIDRIRRGRTASRGAENDRRKVDRCCLIDDDLLNVGMTHRTPAAHHNEAESRYQRSEPLVCPRKHVQLPPFELDDDSDGSASDHALTQIRRPVPPPVSCEDSAEVVGRQDNASTPAAFTARLPRPAPR